MTNKPLAVLLIVSVTVNLLVVGAIAGHLLRGGPEPRFPGHLGRVMENIDPEKQTAIREQLRGFRKEGRALRHTVREQQRQLAGTILQEPFDEQAARAEFAKLRDSSAALQTQMHEQMIMVMKNLEPEERSQLLRKLQRNAGGERGKRGGPTPPP